MRSENLKRIFNPATIAVIGATSAEGKVGHSIMKNLIGSGYDGIVYPINPNRKSVQGVRAYGSISKAPDKIDLAIITTPAPTVPSLVEECGKAGVTGVVIISAGFKEAGKEGQKMAGQILETSQKYGMRVMGPNCLGFIRPKLNLNASFASKSAKKGKIAFVSQSGALCASVLDWANDKNVGFSHFVSIGSMIDISFNDLIDYFGSDPETSSILIYMESLTNARKFLSAARAFARTKPIIVLKVGKSSEGAKAAMSHTGSLTGNDAAFDAAFKRAGIVRVNTIEELFNMAQTLAMQPRPRGKRLAIITNAGGPGVIATDSLMEYGGEVATLSKGTLNKLNAALPPAWSKNNPVDVLGDASPDKYEAAVSACLEDKNVDGILTILTPQAVTDPAETARRLVALKKHGKTVLASWMGGSDVQPGREILEQGNIPPYETPENAVKSFLLMHQYSRNLETLYETPATIPSQFSPNTEANKKLIADVAASGRSTLDEFESKKLLENYGIPIAKSGIAKAPAEAAKTAKAVGFPVAMKILSPDILHKTDVGGVMLNIHNEAEAKKAYSAIISSAKKKMPKAEIHGVFIEKMSKKSHEILIGSKKDPIFGPTIVFGMGGVAVEVFRDTNIGLPPLNMALSMRIIEDTKIYKLLKGYRGMPGVDIKSIQFLLYKFAYLLMDFPEIAEIDINPFAVDDKGGMVLDAKVILDKKVLKSPIKPYSHLVISPYPKEYERKIKLANGKPALLRPVKPEDEPLEGEMFTKFSEETQRFRFFGLIKDITHEMLIRYTQIDYDREIAIIAEVEETKKKKMAGVVRLISDPYNETAEFAIVVADPWHRMGLGNQFTDYILEIAKERGIKKVYADLLTDNYIMRHIFDKRGFKITDDGDTYHAEIELN